MFTRINSAEKIVTLTLDACGGRYDKELIEMLRRLTNVPATLFISGGWIESNREVFKQLAGDTLFARVQTLRFTFSRAVKSQMLCKLPAISQD